MKDQSTQTPAEIAKEAFRRLAVQRITPTPEAYRVIYNEIAGVSPTAAAENVLENFATQLSQATGELSLLGKRLLREAKKSNWQEYETSLLDVLNTLKQPQQKQATAAVVVEKSSSHHAQMKQLRDLLHRTLTFAVATLLANVPELAAEAAALGEAIRAAENENELAELGNRLKQMCFRIELKSSDINEQQEMLLRLFRLLLDNVAFLLEDDSWLRGQINVVKNLIEGPINYRALEDASQSLKEVIYKQGTLKDSLSEAKLTVKNMIAIFIDRLGGMAASTGDYHGKMDMYSQKIAQAQHISELNTILNDVMRDTRHMQKEALQSRDQMLSARTEAENAEARIRALESELAELSAMASHDQLTNSLNRRGLEDAIEREQARADRQGTALSVALLDLDDFKKLNDEHGHNAGDEALIHVVRIIRDTLRAMDVVGRFGGEEFVVVLPDTPGEEATMVITRLQKELTKRIFMYNNQKLFLTFSAGVAVRHAGEDVRETLKRADTAMYQAKKAGKNRVVAAK